jgi:Proteasome subunit
MLLVTASIILLLLNSIQLLFRRCYIQLWIHKIIIMRNHTMNPSSSILHDIQTYDLKSNELSSGTTIMALSTGDAVILGADSRVSTGTYVANRVSDKIAQLSPHIYCCRSGSAADTQFLTDIVKHYLSQLTYVRFNFFSSKVIIFFLLLWSLCRLDRNILN